MFEFIRNHQRLMQFFLMLIIVPSFAFVGLGSYSSFHNSEDVVAKVDGKSITQQEWDAVQRDQMNRYRQMLGAQFDAKMFDTPEMKQRSLDELVARKAIIAEVTRSHLTVPDSAIQDTIRNIPGMTLPDGKFDSERYKAVLQAQGMTPAALAANIRQDKTLQQLNTAIQATAFAPKTLAARMSEINDQEREIQELAIKAAEYAPQVKLTDEMLKDYYSKNPMQFEIPEQVKAEYVVLNGDAIASQITVSDDEVKARYDENIKHGGYTDPEQRRASHILIEFKKDATDKAAAKTKVEGLLAQLRKNPDSFAKLAKENSKDAGSAELGGDLGFFGKGAMKNPAFEDAVFKLKQGEISDVVESDFGYHIIQLTGIKPATVKTLDQVKNELAAEMKKPLAAKKFSESAEIFNNMVYEQADSLKPVADKLGLKIETAANLTRVPNPAIPRTVAVNNPKFLKALFSDEAIKNKHNTEAVEVAPSTLLAAHVVEYKPASKRPFEEVKEAIRAQVTQTEAAKLAVKAGEAKLAALKAKDDASAFAAAPKSVSRSKQAGLIRDALAAVMRADLSKLPAYVGVEVPGQGYGVYRINKLLPLPATDVAHVQQQQQQTSNAVAQQEMFSYIEALKQKAKVQIIKTASANTHAAESKGVADATEK